MYKNNFDEVFDRMYKTSGLRRFALPFGHFGKNDEFAYYHFLARVLNDCFDEEIAVSDIVIDRYEYEKSAPQHRYENFERALFQSGDLGLSVVISRAEISVHDIVISEPDTFTDPEGVFDNTVTTGMIFAAARFPNALSVPDMVKTAVFLAKLAEKVYVSAYENTLYVEIDYKKLFSDRMSKGYVRRACLNVCDYISLILNIVEQAQSQFRKS